MADNSRTGKQEERKQGGRGEGPGKGMEPTRSNTPGKGEGNPEGKRSNERMDTPRKQEERSRGGAGSSGTVQEYTEANRDRGTRGSKEGENRNRAEERRRSD